MRMIAFLIAMSALAALVTGLSLAE